MLIKIEFFSLVRGYLISVYIHIYTYEQRLKRLSTSNLTKSKRKRVNKHCRGMQSGSNCTWIERGPII
jgi:hypothetical protein